MATPLTSVDAVLTRHGVSVEITAALLADLFDRVPRGGQDSIRSDAQRDAASIAAIAPIAGVYSAAEVAANNKVSPSTVRRWASAEELISFHVGPALRFPRFQFDDGGRLLPQIKVIIERASAVWSVPMLASFLDTSQEELSIDGTAATPREWLARGHDPAEVLELIDISW